MKGEAVRQDCAVLWCKGYQEHRCNGDPVETVSLRESIDQDSAMGRAMLHLAIVFAEMERDLARARTMAGLERVKATGKHLGRRKGVAGSGPKRYRTCGSATASHGAASPR